MNRLHTNLSPLLACLVCAGLVLGACSDDPVQDAPVQENYDTPDTDLPDEGIPESDVAPPTPAAYLQVSVSPTRIAHARGSEIHPVATVYDASGNILADREITWTITPVESIEPADSGRYTLLAEGLITFEACTQTSSAESTPFCDQITIRVDDGPPALEIYSPQPGAELGAQGAAVIEVRGRVDDHQEPIYVHVNGVAVAVDENGEFARDLTPHFGINSIEVTASDSIHSQATRKRLDVLWATEYLPPRENINGILLNDGIIFRLGQNFFDNGQPPTIFSEAQIDTKDLADILYLVLSYIDLSQQIPNPVVDSSAFYLEVDSIDVVDPFVVIDVTDEGLELFIQLSHVQANTGGFIELGDQTLSLEGHITAALSIVARISVAKLGPESPFAIELEHFELAMEGAQANFESLEANAIFELAESALRGNLEAILLDTINTSFVDVLPALLIDLFSSLEQALAGQSIAIDLGLGDPFELSFNGRIGSLATAYRSGLEGAVEIDMSVDRDAVNTHTRGVALMVPLAKEPPFFHQTPIQIGLRLAMVNGILHTLWNGGMLELEVGGLLPGAAAALIQDATLSAKLPPLISPPLFGENHDLLLHLGQLEVHLEYTQQTDVFGANLAVGIDLVVDEGEIALTISDEPILGLWLIETTGRAPVLAENNLRQIILNQLWPELEASLGEGLSFGLPIPELGGLSEFAPALDALQLELRMLRPLTVREGFIFLDAGFEGTLPLGL